MAVGDIFIGKYDNAIVLFYGVLLHKTKLLN